MGKACRSIILETVPKLGPTQRLLLGTVCDLPSEQAPPCLSPPSQMPSPWHSLILDINVQYCQCPIVKI